MKINFICFKFSKVFLLVSCIFLLLITSFIIKIKNLQEKDYQEQLFLTPEEDYNNTIVENIVFSSENSDKIQMQKKSRVLQEKLKGFEIIGKIEIPKLKIEKYILSETNTKSLKASVTKVCGPNINEIGNFCIAGHNYNSVFGKIKALKKDDKIILTDIYGYSTLYQIYDVYKTSPKDTSCLSQDTDSEKELTLITCTAGATKRIIVKAIEIYD